MLRLLAPPARRPRRVARLRPVAERLEPRLALDGSAATYTWTGLGDGTHFNDPSNWTHVGPYGGGVGVTGVPAIGSNLVFPPFSWLPADSPTTIDFNGSYGGYPFGTVEIDGSYTFIGNGITVGGGILVTNPSYAPTTDATIELSSLNLGRQATIATAPGSVLNIDSATDPVGLQLTLLGGLTLQGGGQVSLNTGTIADPRTGFALQTFEVAGGTLALGTSMNLSNGLMQVDPGATMDVADGAAVQVGSLSGSGTVDLEGTGASGDATGLTAFTPGGESDVFSGSVVGSGQLAMQGNGTLTLGGIALGTAGAVDVVLGTLLVDGPITAGTLQVESGTFGGLGAWSFSGPVSFGAGSTFDLTLDGLAAGSQSTQLVGTDSIDLGNATLAGTVDYEYQAGDSFTIVTAPTIQGVFQNVVDGRVLIGGNIPIAVASSSDSVTITVQQSETSTQLSTSGSPSHPGQPVTFTATVGTRTTPVSGGTVSFEEDGTVLATEPVAGGTASFTTTALPLGSTTLTAVFGGVGNILGSASAAVTQAVVPYATTTTVSTAPNPSRFRQAVTLTATVTADGMPVTSGSVSFLRGNTRIGVVPLGPDGIARLTTTSLPRRSVRIQASFGGNVDDDGSVSPVESQAVDRAATATTLLAATTRAPTRGRVRTVLVASVEVIGLAGASPAGAVVFRRNGRAIGRARLVGGGASIVLPGGARGRGRFVATFEGNPRFGASTSASLVLPV